MDFFIYVCKRRRMCVLQVSEKTWETPFFCLAFLGREGCEGHRFLWPFLVCFW